jgi:hypothetical protein
MIDATVNADRALWMTAAVVVYIAVRRLAGWLWRRYIPF